ncbi:predicted protein [Scheffersomyces stipitis CBS 6054]|uniref:Protein MSS2, mitochondrial n=1 Tax=Scheffersomyces stipitis (strain ATCC 58785 / CBS 6054 / NBRC 10063 / NRRL Y-11545) TaxID=322104 RepID=A3LNN3_PICST|nr:predicted protein [Scheffersomyces stipitis CBS 6054]ABN64890.2 predicted protein [Scheffersomyces stipitis CBS 6054]KAG2736820.1 hypothetical protein G9P44_000910 [Scheffersomyces stipitis]
MIKWTSRGSQTLVKVRYNSTASSLKPRPDLLSILPKKRTLNRILFDNDVRLSYSKTIPVLQSIYKHLDTPEEIRLPKFVKAIDLMKLKSVLTAIRTTTNSINKNLVALENELVEQAAEFGDNDAIAILAFETIGKRVDGEKVSKEDYDYATKLVKNLTELQQPLVFKLAGDLAFKQKYYEQAAQYWLQFVDLEPDTILASQVYANLGLYYFTYITPRPDLHLAKKYFEKSIAVGELDKFTIQSHYYLGQLYTTIDPQVSKYHWQISAGRGLKESFASLGFLEMNVFQNYDKAIEWFRLGVEAANDVSCSIGQFDAYLKLSDYKSAYEVLSNLNSISTQIQKLKSNSSQMSRIPPEMAEAMKVNESLLEVFYRTRSSDISSLPSKL